MSQTNKYKSDVANCTGPLLIWFPVLLSGQCKVASVFLQLIGIPALISPFISSLHSPLKVNYL